MPDSNYELWKNREVVELSILPDVSLSDEVAERHRIYCLALMSLTLYYWNGNKYGRYVTYPLNEMVPAINPGKLGDDYIGHNIAALIVDGDGLIIDMDFNHNEIYNSSVEHAESRLLRRTFSLSQIQDSWDLGRTPRERNYSTLLRDASLYTTLESCAQCSGIMALAQLKEVIYVQRDPGQYFIGNMMRNMTAGTGLQAPLPIPGSAIRLNHFELLNEAYANFQQRDQVVENAMVLDKSGNVISGQSYTKSITSFLCTRAAREIFLTATDEFGQLAVGYPDWKPDPSDARQLTNAEVLVEARHFVNYATMVARRGSPHRS